MKNEKMKNQKMMSMLALGVIALLGVSFAAAYHGDYSKEGPNYSEDRHEAITEAFEKVDYDAWVVLMTEDGRHPRVVDIVTEDNFAVFVEAHEARKDGNFVLATELRAELGLGDGIGLKAGNEFKGENGMRQGFKMKGQGSNGVCPYAS